MCKKYLWTSLVVKNFPANAGDMGSIPGLGRSQKPWSNKAHVPQLLSLRSRTQKPQLLSLHAVNTEAHVPKAHAPPEKPPQWEAWVLCTEAEKDCVQQQRPSTVISK